MKFTNAPKQRRHNKDTFGLPYLGYAGTPALNRFGLDVYNAKV